MSRFVFDFLRNTELLDGIDVGAAVQGASEGRLATLLADYRVHCLEKAALELIQLQQTPEDLSVQLGTESEDLVDIELIKQLSLYVDAIILDDPVFRFSATQSVLGQELSKRKTGTTGDIDRKRLVEALKYIDGLTPLVALGVVRFLPLSYFHEAPDVLPLEYSKEAFADRLPLEVLEFLRTRARVVGFEMVSTRGHMRYLEGSPPRPAPSLMIEYPGHSEKAHFYDWHVMEPLSFDEATGKLKVRINTDPGAPEQETFDHWVQQSLNRSAGDLFSGLVQDLYNAKLASSYYLTRSSVVADLLNLRRDGSATGPEEDVLNLLLQLELPVAREVSVSHLARVRSEEGDAHQQFRTALAQSLLQVRMTSDPIERKKKLDSVAYELQNVGVRNVALTLKRLRQTLLISGSIGVAGLCATISASEYSVLASLIAGLQIGKTWIEASNRLNAEPAFFLWKLRKER